MDKKIQDAAGNFQPPFQEDDWNGMNMLLDKHLPQEKKKRPFLFGLLPFLLLGIPAWVMLTTYKAPPGPALIAQKIETHSSKENKTAQLHPQLTEEKTVLTGVNAAPVSPQPAQAGIENYSGPDGVQQKEKRVTTINTNREIKRQKTATAYASKSNEGPVFPAVTEPVNPGTTVHNPTVATSVPAIGSGNTASTTDKKATDPPIAEKTDTADSLPPAEPLTKDKKPGDRKGGKWQINLSAGPDLSLVGMGKTGKWKMQYGLGVSYAFSDRLQVRTGFMVSRKLYYADSSDYHPPKGFWNYYTNLQKIDANCLVYEIPLNMVYTFPSAKKHQWFVSGGLSSYLMKKETYEYYFKDAWGMDQYRERSVQNENDHFFSILQLSGGYQYKFSDKLSLMAEPYMKLPLSGVGFGKVKLNNTGVLFTLGYKPFVKSK